MFFLNLSELLIIIPLHSILSEDEWKSYYMGTFDLEIIQDIRNCLNLQDYDYIQDYRNSFQGAGNALFTREDLEKAQISYKKFKLPKLHRWETNWTDEYETKIVTTYNQAFRSYCGHTPENIKSIGW